MRKFVVFFLAALIACTCLNVSAAAVSDPSVASGCSTLNATYALSDASSYDGKAQAVILYERNTQTLVCACNPDKSINPTGLTKIMATLVALEQGNIDEMVTVKQSTLNKLSASAKKLGLRGGDQLTLRDLLYCVMLVSANDAMLVAAEQVAGSQEAFVELMNARAATMGCVNTHFSDVNGLKDDTQRSTARELAIITEQALKNETFAAMFGTVNYWLPGTVSCDQQLTTTNGMCIPENKSYDARVTGGRPAAVSGSDRSFIATAVSEDKSYLCVLISVTGSTSNYTATFAEARKLFERGFSEYAVQQVLDAQEPVALYEVENGANGVVVGAAGEAYALLPTTFDKAQLQYRLVRGQSLQAPISAGAEVGTLQVCYGDIVVAQVPLCARHDVAVRGTNIRYESPQSGNSLLTVLKWGGIALLALVVLATAALLILRRINIVRYRKKRQRSGRTRREEIV